VVHLAAVWVEVVWDAGRVEAHEILELLGQRGLEGFEGDLLGRQRLFKLARQL
jgi:hypothetical protein